MTSILERLRLLVPSDSSGAAFDAVNEITRLTARVAQLEGALIGTTASLVAAISLLERGGKKAAPSDTMFAMMLGDYRKAVGEARAALTQPTPMEKT